MPEPIYDQTIVDLTPHKFKLEAAAPGVSSLDLFLDVPDTVERATANANTVQMLKTIQALATTALRALGEE